MKKTDTERLKKIVSLWDALSSEIERRGITREMLLTEQFSQWAVTTPVYNIGEQVYQLSPEFKKEHPDIPWSVVSGLRHRLVHDYDGINWSLIADVIFDDMNPFVEQVKSIPLTTTICTPMRKDRMVSHGPFQNRQRSSGKSIGNTSLVTVLT